MIESIIREAFPENTGEMGVMPVSPERGSEGEVVSKKSKSKRVAYSVACTLRLSGSDYQVQLLPESSDYEKGYRLNKIESSKPVGYNVIQKDNTILCECADFQYRNGNCKHVKGLVDMGMLGIQLTQERVRSGVFDG